VQQKGVRGGRDASTVQGDVISDESGTGIGRLIGPGGRHRPRPYFFHCYLKIADSTKTMDALFVRGFRRDLIGFCLVSRLIKR
jgi:hypothetical protein